MNERKKMLLYFFSGFIIGLLVFLAGIILRWNHFQSDGIQRDESNLRDLEELQRAESDTAERIEDGIRELERNELSAGSYYQRLEEILTAAEQRGSEAED